MAGDRESSEAYVTLATNDAYGLGALVLSQSLRSTGTTRHLVVMVTDQISQSMREALTGAFDSVVEVHVLDSEDAENLALLNRADLGLTFTKLHCWRLTQFKKCVFLDADTLVLQNIDDLFDCDELAAAPDVGWPDCFNSGVFVFCPSHQTYTLLLGFAISHGSFDGGDQGLLNQYFSDWSTQGRNRRLPFTYNTVAHTFYSYAPAFKQYGHNVKVVHFIGAVKPWHATNVSQGGASGQPTDFLQLWWRVYKDMVHPRLNDTLKTLVAEPDVFPSALGVGPDLTNTLWAGTDWTTDNVNTTGNKVR
jgi:glycogenin glucosyltransferase